MNIHFHQEFISQRHVIGSGFVTNILSWIHVTDLVLLFECWKEFLQWLIHNCRYRYFTRSVDPLLKSFRPLHQTLCIYYELWSSALSRPSTSRTLETAMNPSCLSAVNCLTLSTCCPAVRSAAESNPLFNPEDRMSRARGHVFTSIPARHSRIRISLSGDRKNNDLQQFLFRYYRVMYYALFQAWQELQTSYIFCLWRIRSPSMWRRGWDFSYVLNEGMCLTRDDVLINVVLSWRWSKIMRSVWVYNICRVCFSITVQDKSEITPASVE